MFDFDVVTGTPQPPGRMAETPRREELAVAEPAQAPLREDLTPVPAAAE
jgi:hypothetical protein